MAILIDLALLLIGAVGTLAAFGGKTWTEGSDPVVQRVTPRGWVSLVCLVLAVVFGITKSVVAKLDQDRKDAVTSAEKDKAKADAEADKASLNGQLLQARTQAELADEELKQLQKSDDSALTQLGEQKTTLSDVRVRLKSTKDDLSRETRANMLLGFANEGRIVKDVKVFLPLAERSAQVKSINEAFLPRFDVESCKEHTQVDVSVAFTGTSFADLRYEPSDEHLSHKYYLEHPPRADLLQTFDRNNDLIRITEDREDTPFNQGHDKEYRSTRYGYNLQIRSIKQNAAAAQMYRLFANSVSRSLTIYAQWPETTELYPKRCEDTIRKYFEVAFSKALLIIVLDDKQNETLVFRMKALPPEFLRGIKGQRFTRLSVPFTEYSDPLTLAGEGDFELVTDWPDSAASEAAPSRGSQNR
jgi:hypothetical protein